MDAEKEMFKKCECGHKKADHFFNHIPEGEDPEVGTGCKTCECERFKNVECCEECGEPLKTSQYARVKREGEQASKTTDNLVCRNFPDCPKAEKEV